MAETFIIKTKRAGELVEVVDGVPQFETQVLEVTRTETKVDTYTLEQARQYLENIDKELANVQARRDYMANIVEQLTK